MTAKLLDADRWEHHNLGRTVWSWKELVALEPRLAALKSSETPANDIQGLVGISRYNADFVEATRGIDGRIAQVEAMDRWYAEHPGIEKLHSVGLRDAILEMLEARAEEL